MIAMLAGARMLRGVGNAAIDVTKPHQAAAKNKKEQDLPPADGNSGAGQVRIQASTTEMLKKTDKHTAAVNDAMKDPE